METRQSHAHTCCSEHKHEAHHHEHHHHHGHHHHHHGGSGSNLLFAFAMNLFFAIVELVGGIFTGSVAILSDALHDFGDSISLGVAWRLQKLSEKGRDTSFSYGYKRFSLLGALLISLILLVGSVFVIIAAIERLSVPGEPKAGGMLVLAIFGLAVNGLAAFRLKGSSSLNERAVMLHLMEDVLGWAAVLVVSIVMLFVNAPILDPILSLCITAWILYNVYGNLRETFKVMLQGVPDGIDLEGLKTDILSLPHIRSVHDIHLWTLDGESHVMTIHVVYCLDDFSSPQAVFDMKESVREKCSAHGIRHATIELDPEGCSCGMEGC